MSDIPDMSCTEEHQDLKGKIVGLQDTLHQHVDEVHAKLLTVDQIEARDRLLGVEIEELACVVLGKKRSAFMGGGRDSSGSMKQQLDALHHEVIDNGGIKTRLSKGVVGLLVATIGALGYIGSSVISHSGDTQKIVEQVLEQVDQRLTEFELELP